MIKVFIIDDHQMIIEGIHSLLQGEADIEWMGSARLPDELMNFLKEKAAAGCPADGYQPSLK